MKLGKREMDALTCPPGRKDTLVFDDELTGFAVRVTAAGTKTFIFQYRHGTIVRRLRLGEYGDLTPVQARRLAEEARGSVAAGGDPAATRKERVAAIAVAERAARRQKDADALTLRVLIDRWEKLGLSDRGELHRTEAARAVMVSLQRFLDEPAHGLDAATTQRTIDRIARNAPVMARRVRDYARAMFNWAILWRLFTENPFAAVEIGGRQVTRDRVLTDAELGEAWRASKTLGAPFSAYFRVLILTLQRRGEVAGMRWSEISEDWSVWTVPAERTKNGKAHVVHLSPPVRAILRAVPEHKGSDLVFTTTGTTEISGFHNAKERLIQAILEERTERAADRGLDRDPEAIADALDERAPKGPKNRGKDPPSCRLSDGSCMISVARG